MSLCSHAYGSDVCRDLRELQSEKLGSILLTDGDFRQIEVQFRSDMEHISTALESLRLSPETLERVRWLGEGASQVYEVSYQGRKYALKVFQKIDEASSSAHVLRRRRMAITEAVIMQKALGELGMAPRVKGVFYRNDIGNWARANNSSVKEPSFGLLMEMSVHRTLKTDRSQVNNFSEEVLQRLRHQSEVFVGILNRLDIKVLDGDAVITPDLNLQLIDISSYEYLPGASTPPNRHNPFIGFLNKP